MAELTRSSARDPGDYLAAGFGIAVAMWGIGYLTHLPGARVPGAIVLALLAACVLAGGWLVGRYSARRVRAGLYAGFTAGAVNLLVLGSLLFDPESGSIRSLAWLWVPVSIVACGLVAAGGAALGCERGFSHQLTGRSRPVGDRSSSDRSETGPPFPEQPIHGVAALSRAVGANWPAVFAFVMVGATLFLLSVGGTVTGYEAGLAVPDWPRSFGYNMFLYPLARMSGGIYYEHAHRLFGSLVGLTTLAVAAYLLAVERRGWVKGLAVGLLAAVIVQGVIGGLRVTGRFTLSDSPELLSPSLNLAILHGVLGQMILAGMGALAVVLTRTWHERREQTRTQADRIDTLFGAVCIAAVLVQLVLGALLRHLGHTWALHLHIGWAVLVLAVAAVFAIRAWGLHDERSPLPTLGGALLIVLGLQLLLGFGALFATSESGIGPQAVQVIITTAHQTTGAAVLMLTTALWTYHLARRAVAEPLANVESAIVDASR